jgi:BR serine/threonine kinase
MKSNIAETACGSPHYAAPEVVRGGPYDGRAADVWSCGVILFALLAGRLPFDDPSMRTLLAKVKAGRFLMPSTFSASIQDLISKMLCVDPQRRISIGVVKSHPAFRIGLNSEYKLPVPIPIAGDRAPITEIDRAVMPVLEAIGYGSEDAITAELQSSHFSMAKVFYAMYHHQSSIAALPWSTMDQVLEPNGAEFQQSPDLMALTDDLSGSSIGFNRPGTIPQSVPDQFSYTEGATWAPALPQETREVAECHTDIPCPLEDLWAKLQELLRQQSYEMFHPDPALILARNRDGGQFLILRAAYTGDHGITLALLVPEGSPPDYSMFTIVREAIHAIKLARASA